jgi:hypothetical protein
MKSCEVVLQKHLKHVELEFTKFVMPFFPVLGGQITANIITKDSWILILIKLSYHSQAANSPPTLRPCNQRKISGQMFQMLWSENFGILVRSGLVVGFLVARLLVFTNTIENGQNGKPYSSIFF